MAKKTISQALKDLFLNLGGDPSALDDNTSASDYIQDLESAIKSGEVEKASKDTNGKELTSYVAGATLTGTDIVLYDGNTTPVGDPIELGGIIPAATSINVISTLNKNDIKAYRFIYDKDNPTTVNRTEITLDELYDDVINKGKLVFQTNSPQGNENLVPLGYIFNINITETFWPTPGTLPIKLDFIEFGDTETSAFIKHHYVELTSTNGVLSAAYSVKQINLVLAT